MKYKTQTKDKIIDAAWTLFLQQGYENTTINEIIELSGTSRGAFYHHFQGKEELVFSVTDFFDADYKKWMESIDPNMNALDKLFAFNSFVLENIENSPYRSFLPELYGMQVMTAGTRYIVNPEREYYKILRNLMQEGIAKGEIQSDLSYASLAERYSIIERGYIYDWCLNHFRYSVHEYGQRTMKILLDSLRPQQSLKKSQGA